MLTSLSLPALAVLISFPSFGFRQQRPAAPADSLPPAWKSASRLALENQFVWSSLPVLRSSEGSARLELRPDPRLLHATFDPDSGVLQTAPQVGEFRVGPASQRHVGEFSRELGAVTFRKLWLQQSREKINTRAAMSTSGPRSGLTFEAPRLLPPKIQSFLGPGSPALNVSGSESIKLSGQSNWSNQQLGPLGTRRSLFPTLNMQQDLDIRLEGQLSDRIKVNLLQNSANQIPLANRIAINYRGDEDDLVQALDLGNTNLTLPGTQYVSYSGKNEGLFGVKASSRYGPLDFTVLASKQEGKSERASYAGGSSKQSQTLRDFDYDRGRYFFLYDPNEPTMDIEDASIRLYRDDATGQVDINTVRGRAFVNPLGTGDIDTTRVDGSFRLLVAGAEEQYEIMNDVYSRRFKVIRLRQPMTGNQKLAVTYRARFVNPDGSLGATVDVGRVDGIPQPIGADGDSLLAMKLIRAPSNELKADPDAPNSVVANFDTVLTRAPLNATRELELRNFYQLPGQRIDKESFRITIRQGTGDPPVTAIQGAQVSVPYIEAAGLDNFDETSGSAVRAHDGRVDGTLLTSNTRPFVDFQNGILFFPDLRPFAPRLTRPFEKAIDDTLNRREALTGTPDPHSTDNPVPNASNPTIYDRFNPIRDQSVTYLIDVDFTAAQAAGEITLGRGNILEGSEVVNVNGQTWVRDRDYSIDYDLGRVTLKRQLGAGDNLNVDYSYAPLFQQAGRTLVGSAFRIEGRERSLGGAFMYESKGAQDLRPRIGEEPSRSLIADVNSEWNFKPEWMTRLVDRLPGVRTTTPSEFRIQAEVGASFPNPNTRNEVYLDDMEGVRDAVSLSMTADRWHLSSIPQLKVGVGIDVPVSDSASNVELRYYSPPSVVQERDLKPSLEEGQGALNTRQALALSVPRRPQDAPSGTSPLWAGLTYLLDPVGLDLSRSQFIELWVNDFNDQHAPGDGLTRVRGRDVKLHIDIGAVGEDQQRAPNIPPNGAIDSEDALPHDDQLTVTSDNNEDTGLDGLTNAEGESPPVVPDLTTVTPTDPAGDDFTQPGSDVGRNKETALDPNSWRGSNGTEDNKNVNPTPDTEDLNLDRILDPERNYIEYTIHLGDTASRYLVTDVRRDFGAAFPTIAHEANGWRRYRIPIDDSLSVRFGVPNLVLARHVRVWLQDVVETDSSTLDPTIATNKRPLLMLGSLDIVGSRWQAATLSQAQRDSGTTQTLNSVNSVDNADIYRPPFDPGESVSGSQGFTRREQSLSLEFTQLLAGDTLEAFKTFSVDENYSRYGKLDWFATGFDIRGYTPGVDSVYYFVRFSSDEFNRNYYEYRAPVPNSSPGAIDWREVKLALTDLSNLKLAGDFPRTDPILYEVAGANPGERYVVRGRPSFTRLRRISIGLVNATSQVLPAGQLWFDELRAIDVAKDVDHAQRVQVNGRMANLFSYNLGWNGRGADFLSVGESRGSGSSTDQLAFGSTFDLHRFFAATGVVIPISVSYSRNSVKPRFTAGDDVVRTGSLADASETRNESRTFSTSYSRAWSERSNPFLRYTVGGITASYSWSKSTSFSPSSKDSSVSTGAAVNYNVSPRKLLAFGIPFSKGKFYLLPERAYWNYTVGTSTGQGYDRIGAQRDSLLPRTRISGRNAFIDFGADSRPIDLFHHHFDARRNLTLPAGEVRNERLLGFANVGRVTSWRQTFDARYGLNLHPWLRPALSWNSQYQQNNGPELSRDLHVRAVGNGQAMSLTWDLPFDKLVGIRPAPTLADTSRPAKRSSPLDWRAWLARLGPISTDASFNQTSSFSRLSGTPDLFYLVGVSRAPGLSADSAGGVRAEEGNDASQAQDWRTGARSRINFLAGSLLNTRFEMTGRTADLNGLRNRTRSMRFPDLEVEYGRLPRALGLDRILTNPQVRTAYNRASVVEHRNNSSTPTGKSASSEWRPLLGLNGTLRNGARTELRVERRVTQREDLSIGHSVATDRNTSVNFSINRSYTQGQKLKILGKTNTISSSISIGMTGVYERRSGETIQRGFEQPQLVTKEDRLSLNGTGSYGFSSNVTGNLSLGYGQTNNKRLKIVNRNIRVELRAQFTF